MPRRTRPFKFVPISLLVMSSLKYKGVWITFFMEVAPKRQLLPKITIHILKYFSDWPGIEFLGGCVCILQTRPWRTRNYRKMRFLIHLLQPWCWMQLLLNAIIWDLSWVLHKNWNAQTATRFGWLLGSSWWLLGKAATAAWAGCWQPQPCSFPSRWHPQPKESWRELHISSQKAARS